MSWFEKLLPPKIKRKEESDTRKIVPEGLCSKCASCEAVLYYSDLENNLNVCPKCNFHNRPGDRGIGLIKRQDGGRNGGALGRREDQADAL